MYYLPEYREAMGRTDMMNLNSLWTRKLWASTVQPAKAIRPHPLGGASNSPKRQSGM